MKRVKYVLTGLVIASACFFSCDERRKPTGNGGGGGNVNVESLPSTVGMLWVYEVYDSLTAQTDTVWVSVTDSLNSGGDSTLHRWRTWWAVADSFSAWYVMASANGDTVDIRSESRPWPTLLDRFVLPLSLGSGWTGDDASDTSHVIDTGAVNVPAGRFFGALIERNWDQDFEGGGRLSRTWVAPEIGMVSRYREGRYSDGTTVTVNLNQTWELIRYDLSTFAVQQFPNTVGSEWVYRYENIDAETVDTVTVTIVKNVPLAWADSGTLWQYIGSEYTDTIYVGYTNGSLTVSWSPDFLYVGSWYYDFPLAVGRNWGIEFLQPVPEIINKGPIDTPGGQFESAFHYRMFGGGFNYDWTQEEWLVPDVGAVKRKQMILDLGPPIYIEWTLLSYQLP